MAVNLGDHQRRQSTSGSPIAQRNGQNGSFLRRLTGRQKRWAPRTKDSVDWIKPGPGFCFLLAANCPPARSKRLRAHCAVSQKSSTPARVANLPRPALAGIHNRLFPCQLASLRWLPLRLLRTSLPIRDRCRLIAASVHTTRSLPYLTRYRVVYNDEAVRPRNCYVEAGRAESAADVLALAREVGNDRRGAPPVQHPPGG